MKREWFKPEEYNHVLFCTVHEAFGKKHALDSAGGYEIVEGGFVPFGCRSILPNEKVARRKVIGRAIGKLAKEKRELELALAEIDNQNP